MRNVLPRLMYTLCGAPDARHCVAVLAWGLHRSLLGGGMGFPAMRIVVLHILSEALPGCSFVPFAIQP